MTMHAILVYWFTSLFRLSAKCSFLVTSLSTWHSGSACKVLDSQLVFAADKETHANKDSDTILNLLKLLAWHSTTAVAQSDRLLHMELIQVLHGDLISAQHLQVLPEAQPQPFHNL